MYFSSSLGKVETARDIWRVPLNWTTKNFSYASFYNANTLLRRGGIWNLAQTTQKTLKYHKAQPGLFWHVGPDRDLSPEIKDYQWY